MIILSLGSNLGNREEHLEKAQQLLRERAGNITKVSSVYQTAAWGDTEQPDYLNIALQIETSLSAEDLMKTLLAIEKKLGRVRGEKRWQARTIDIDILCYEQLVVNTPDLMLPHPRLQDRKFVLLPMAEIALEWVHPILKKTVLDLLDICNDEGEVIKMKNLL